MLKTGLEFARRQQEDYKNRSNELLSLQQTEANSIVSECVKLRKIIVAIEQEKEKARQDAESAHTKIQVLEEDKKRLEMELGEAMKSEAHLRNMLTDTQTIMNDAASNMNEISGGASVLQEKLVAAESLREKAEKDLQTLQCKHDAMEVRLRQMMEEVATKDMEAQEARVEAKRIEDELEEDTKRKLELQEKLHSLLQNPRTIEASNLQMRLKIAEKAVEKFEKRIEHTVPIINALQHKWMQMEASSKEKSELMSKKLKELQRRNRDPNISGIANSAGDEMSADMSQGLMDKANNLAASAALRLQEARNTSSTLRNQLLDAKKDSKLTKTEVKKHLPEMEMAMVSATDQLKEIILDFKSQIELETCDDESIKRNESKKEFRMRKEMASKIANTLTLIEQDFSVMAKGLFFLENDYADIHFILHTHCV